MIRRGSNRISKQFVFLLCLLFFNLFIFFSTSPVFGDEQNTILKITPGSQIVNASNSFTISVNCTPGSPVKGFELELSFDSSLVYAVSVTEGDFFEGYNTFFNPGVIDNNAGKITNVFDLIIGSGNVSSSGCFINVLFTAKSISGTSPLVFSNVGEWTGVTDEEGYLPISVNDGGVTITGGSENPIVIPNDSINDTESENTPPVILNKPVGPVYVEIGVEYYYKISGYDNEGENIRVMFDWGDGNFSDWSDFVSSNESVGLHHVFNSPSYYLLRAKAQDESGLNSSWSKSLTIIVTSSIEGSNNDIDPDIYVVYDENGFQNQTINFFASDSLNESIDIIIYIWDFGDNETESGKSVEHIYKEPGVYTVNLTMIDANGNVYTKTMLVSISESDIDSISKQKGGNENNYGLFFIFLFVIIIFVILILIFINRKKIIGQISGNKKLGFLNLLSRRGVDKINKKIEKINFALKNYDNSSDKSVLKSGSFDDYSLIDISVLKDDSYYDNNLESFTKSDFYSKNEKIDKLVYKESLKSDDDLDKSELVDIDFLVDILLEKKFKEKSLNNKKKNDFFDDVSKNDS